ncbi:uncharacterized protein LOC111052716 [Nilaparvata lugens]|uniref:uncharacterized protein LOC111052716 n=1 Tax=Nilaparvata lugens TaxID=108931 RepID=UPI00193D41D7|nr:uncharacterized protein LOC111052716 [Nilaparvata lugens]
MAYDITLWGGASEVKDILLVQKKAIRILYSHCIQFLHLQVSYKGIPQCRTLPTRGDVHDHGTRGRLRLDLLYCRLGRTQSSLNYQPAKILNKLPVSARTLPETVLKRRLRAFLQENPFYSMREFYDCDPQTFQNAWDLIRQLTWGVCWESVPKLGSWSGIFLLLNCQL